MTAFLNLCLPVFGADSAATALACPSIPLIPTLLSSGHFCRKGTQTAQRQELIVLCCQKHKKKPLTTPSINGTLGARDQTLFCEKDRDVRSNRAIVLIFGK